MPPAIVYDLLRLLLGAADPVGRGIDQVDRAYARHLFTAWPAACHGLLPTPWGLRLYGRARVLRGLDALDALAGAPRTGAGVARLLAATGLAAGLPAGAAPQGALYLNIGQLGWAAPIPARLLRRRPDLRAVFLLHDAIPLERPDLVTPLGTWAHRHMLDVACRHAAGLIFTTAAAAEQVLRHLPPPLPPGRAPPRSIAVPLPVPAGWTRAAPSGGQPPYFVAVGALEPRKNHTLLLQVWQALRLRVGGAVPGLVIAGRPARGGRPVLRALRAARGPDLIVLRGLPGGALRGLIAGARALLMPSLAEGFGLPIIESLALGTPVLASDLPAHREAGGGFATYLDPGDPAAWLAAIERHAAPVPPPRVAGYQPLTQAAYFARIDAFLSQDWSSAI